MRFAVIAYPDMDPDHVRNFLSFTEERAKYALGISGRFRIIDFIFSVIARNDVRHIFLYQKRPEEQFQEFLQNYLVTHELMRIHLLQEGTHHFISDTMNILKNSRVDAVLMYNGDNPVLFDMQAATQMFIESGKPIIQFVLKNPLKSKIEVARTRFRLLMARRETFLSLLQDILRNNSPSVNVFEQIMNFSSMQNIVTENFPGLFGNLQNISDYYSFNMNILQYQQEFDQYFSMRNMGSFLPQKGSSVIGKNGVVYNSVISEGCHIDGIVVDSIVFPGVVIQKDAEVVGSIILPNNHIGANAQVHHALIEEASVRSAKDTSLNIGEHCLIGKIESGTSIGNNTFPDLIRDGLTVIGRNCVIPRKVKIGANCFITPMTDKLKIKMYNRVMDGAVL